MGDIADYYFDKALEQELQMQEKISELQSLYRHKQLYWTTMQGEKILIQDMTDKHLQNTINFLKRNHAGQYLIEILAQELINR